jgi:hypothetical protein
MESLTDLFGFENSSVRLGELKKSQTIREAIVAVPYITDDLSTCGDSFNQQQGSDNKKFIGIPRERVNAVLDVGTFRGDAEISAGDSIRDLVQNVKKYVLPPQFDFIADPTKEPVAMYFFEFEYHFDKDDLSYIWQNLAPRNYKKMEQKIQVSSHNLANNELMNAKDILENENLRWMVFKVKQRSMAKYENKVYRQIGTRDLKESTKGYQVEYNWPYDYLSFVEMINMDVEVLMDDDNTKTDSLTNIAVNDLPSNIDRAKIKDAVDDKNINRALDTLDLPGDIT